MTFAYESDPSESSRKKIAQIMEEMHQQPSKLATWIVDKDRDLAVVCVEGGNSRDNEITPNKYVLSVGDQIIDFYSYDYGLFCNFEKKMRGLEYLVFISPLQKTLAYYKEDVIDWIREAMECEGYSLSTKLMAVTEVQVRFIEDFGEFQKRYGQGSAP